MRARRELALAWIVMSCLAGGLLLGGTAHALDCGPLREMVVDHPSGMRDQYCAVVTGTPEPIPHGAWVSYDEHGRVRLEGTHDSGRREGVWRSWHANGEISGESTFVQGRRDGRFRNWHPTGQLRLQGAVVGGVYEGNFLRWNDAGIKVSDKHYVAGKKHGPYATWYDDGTPKQLGGFKDDKEHGHWISWYPTGLKRSEGDAENGLRTGQWKFWAGNGEVLVTGQYVGREFARDSAFRIPEGATPEEIFSPPPATGILKDVGTLLH